MLNLLRLASSCVIGHLQGQMLKLEAITDEMVSSEVAAKEAASLLGVYLSV